MARSAGQRTIVIALGGNALQPPGERGEIAEQFAHTRASLRAIVALARAGWGIAIVHGNGPQIGDELLRNELASWRRPPLPMGVLVAATAGWIGYMIQQSLQNALERAGLRRPVVTLITQVLVDPADAETHAPSKPIGHFMDEATARAMSTRHGWPVREYKDGWRRLVASPVPIAIVEAEQIRGLVETGTVVVAAGGGGTPVRRDPDLGLEGVDAVIDKDRAAQVLAGAIGAEQLLILTNVDGVFTGWRTPDQRFQPVLTVREAERLLDAGEFGAGTMEPKVHAAARFVRDGGALACIARLENGLHAVEGKSGTRIVPDSTEAANGKGT